MSFPPPTVDALFHSPFLPRAIAGEVFVFNFPYHTNDRDYTVSFTLDELQRVDPRLPAVIAYLWQHREQYGKAHAIQSIMMATAAHWKAPGRPWIANPEELVLRLSVAKSVGNDQFFLLASIYRIEVTDGVPIAVSRRLAKATVTAQQLDTWVPGAPNRIIAAQTLGCPGTECARYGMAENDKSAYADLSDLALL